MSGEVGCMATLFSVHPEWIPPAAARGEFGWPAVFARLCFIPSALQRVSGVR